MREFAAAAAPVPTAGNLTDSVVTNAIEFGTAAGFSRRLGEVSQDITWAEFHADVTATARGLLGAGVQPGDRVALLCSTRYEWTVVDYAIWFAGAVTVPIYPSASPEQVGWILADSEAVLAVLETQDQLATCRALQSRLPALRRLLTIDGGQLAMLAHAGESIEVSALEQRRQIANPDTLATILYTSGTTGRPKGCRLTHGNFLSELVATTSKLPELFDAPDARTVLFLPMAHVFARVVGVGCVQTRVLVRHLSDIGQLVDELRDFGPTFLLAVPSVFENLFNAASTRAFSEGRGRAFNAAVDTAVAFSRARDTGGAHALLRVRHRHHDQRSYAALRASLGGRIGFAISGGAPLGERLAHFYRGAGLPILDGYGLTESTAALTLNLPSEQRIGSVGRPVPGTSARVADDGELLFQGPQVFDGYWRDDATTRRTLVDGWLHTGDVGEIDSAGFVRVTGRTEEILVTTGGKNVAPAVLEDRVRASPLVGQCLVVGDGRPFVAALVTLDPTASAEWAARHHHDGALAALSRDPDLLTEIQRAVDAVNATVSAAEAIRRFAVLDVTWSVDTGELTPTLKVRRHVVQRRFHDDIEALYH